jgi:hypothetical protein
MTLIFHAAHSECSDLEQADGSGHSVARILPGCEGAGYADGLLGGGWRSPRSHLRGPLPRRDGRKNNTTQTTRVSAEKMKGWSIRLHLEALSGPTHLCRVLGAPDAGLEESRDW